MADKMVRKPQKLTVYHYIPNIIGYIRVLMNCVAFAICVSNERLFSLLYFVSFEGDGIDGWCTRKFNQDMVTDRISTACLLVVLSQVYRPGLTSLLLLALDIASHWLQMYSTFLSGKVSHKDVKDSTNWLLRAYYGNRMFMAFCCVACCMLGLRRIAELRNVKVQSRPSLLKIPRCRVRETRTVIGAQQKFVKLEIC
ncbi:hypothetical protein MLD38_012043 [Melastoma candidum]|uniref:Uncharacterized protein n=1 Tax=Melastoma candidum TaxID=119954 RepID=A0ACB9R4M3_9MYRT|nr:hypothetical protein MLD38_012043 [Melastoma candidum]